MYLCRISQLSFVMSYGSTECHEEPPDTGIDAERRTLNTGETLLWKIFPAGFGWQAAGLLASKWMGLHKTSICFALMTGAGNLLGFLLGHMACAVVKETWFDPRLTTSREAHVAIFLACSAFLSGSAWQPAVNFLSSFGLGFNAVAVGSGLVSGMVFFIGLRLGRTVYSRWKLTANVKPFWDCPQYMPVVEPASPENLVFDLQLAGSIAGAAACFLGIDVSFGASNWMRPFFGVEATTSPFHGCIKAGCTSLLGFGVVQVVQNCFVPRDGCWTDKERPIDVALFAQDFVKRCKTEGIFWWF